MPRGKSVDRSGCSLVATVILIAGSHCLTELPLASYGVTKSEAWPRFLPAERAMRLAVRR